MYYHHYDDCGFLFVLIILSIIFRGRLWGGYRGYGWWPFWFLHDDPRYDSPMYGTGWFRKKKHRETHLPLPPVRKAKANPDFKDEKLEMIIEEGRLRDAREYLQGMLKVANEMDDKQCAANYGKYENMITLAALRVDRKKSRGTQQVRRGKNLWVPAGFDVDAREKQESEKADQLRIEQERAIREREIEQRIADERNAHQQHLLEQAEKRKTVREEIAGKRAMHESAAAAQAEREMAAVEKAARDLASREQLKRERAKKEIEEKDVMHEDNVEMQFFE